MEKYNPFSQMIMLNRLKINLSSDHISRISDEHIHILTLNFFPEFQAQKQFT